ncbi:MAG: glycosyltransferase [Bacteroidales bacterium]|nr:glycosyltransferase [Bacteroidales bacterium]
MTSIILIFSAIITSIYVFLINKCSLLFYKYENNITTKSTTPIDIIVSAKNECENISKLIYSIYNQTYKNIHLIIIDDNSTDNTFQIAQNLQDKYQFTLLKNPNQGKKSALRYALTYSKSKYILFTDCDCYSDKNWAETLINIAETENADMILAPVILVAENKSSLFQRLWEIESFSLITITAGTCINNSPIMCNGGNLLVKRDLRNQSDNYLKDKYASGDDIFLLEYALLNNKKIKYSKSISTIIKTNVANNLSSLINQRSRWVSKSKGYKNKYTIFFALIVFFANILILLYPIILFFNYKYWWIILILWTIKTISDIISAKVSSNYYNYKHNFYDIILLEIIYPIYTLVCSILGFCKNIKWK